MAAIGWHREVDDRYPGIVCACGSSWLAFVLDWCPNCGSPLAASAERLDAALAYLNLVRGHCILLPSHQHTSDERNAVTEGVALVLGLAEVRSPMVGTSPRETLLGNTAIDYPAMALDDADVARSMIKSRRWGATIRRG